MVFAFMAFAFMAFFMAGWAAGAVGAAAAFITFFIVVIGMNRESVSGVHCASEECVGSSTDAKHKHMLTRIWKKK